MDLQLKYERYFPRGIDKDMEDKIFSLNIKSRLLNWTGSWKRGSNQHQPRRKD
jgi:hypothetical protein